MNNRLAFGDTFCVLPWIQLYKMQNGRRSFCCYSCTPLGTDAEITDLKKNILDNIPVKNCEYCYNLERNNSFSPRQKESSIWLKHKEVKNLVSSPEKFNVMSLDLRNDNKCNLACISCSPASSSLWAKELGIKIRSTEKFYDIRNYKELKKVYLAGGEPLIIDSYLNLIKYLANERPDIELVINTNLSRLPDSVIDDLKKINKCSITVSVDSYGAVNEYHRYPLKWSKFLKNLYKLKDTGIPILFNTVIDAVSVFGMAKMKELDNIPEYWNLVIMDTKKELLLENIPQEFKQSAIENLKAFQDSVFYSRDQMFRNKIDYSKKLIDKNGNYKLLSNYIQDLDTRRNINHENYLGVNLVAN